MTARDPGLTAALARAGGGRALARALAIHRASVQQWRAVPAARVFDVARVVALDPEQLRPDLADWIAAERERRDGALTRETRAMIRADRASPPISYEDELAIDILIALAAWRFVLARRREVPGAARKGAPAPTGALRATAMALAHVAGRAKSGNVAVFFGVTRQNVDNASERYLRARDGDDPDDYVAPGRDGAPRVIERGRVRRAKSAAEDLWTLEAAFLDTLATPPERKRA